MHSFWGKLVTGNSVSCFPCRWHDSQLCGKPEKIKDWTKY